MMRVLFATQPGTGHFNPLAPYARALATAGHEVAVACARSFSSDIEGMGFKTIPAGIDWRIDRLSEFFPDAPPPGPERLPWILRHWTSTTAIAMARDVQEAIQHWRPDLIVRERTELGAYLAAELSGIPYATAGSFWSRPLDSISGWDDAVRQQLGLDPDPIMAACDRFLVLASMPPTWVAANETPPPTVHFIRPVAESSTSNPGPFSAPSTHRPLVHVTLGTTEANRTPGIYEAIIAGLQSEPVDLVVALGTAHDPAAFGPQPRNVQLHQYVSHPDLLPRCDLVVNHGGLGTVMSCLDHGVPMVIVPIQGDQPHNARRCADLGLGLVVDPAECTPETIRNAARMILANPSYKANAVRTQSTFHMLPGMDTAIALMERLAQFRQPLLSGEPHDWV